MQITAKMALLGILAFTPAMSRAEESSLVTDPATVVASPVVTPEAPKAAEGLRMSGLVYSDYYWVAASHSPSLIGSDSQNQLNGVWLRRVWLTGDKDLGNGFSTRLRLEFNGADFQAATTTTHITPYLKDAWIKWSYADHHRVAFGLVETASIGYVEKHWGYRAVEKTPLDLQGWANTREQGLSLDGEFGSLGYQLVAGDGTSGGVTPQILDNGKKIQLGLSQALPAGLSLWVYGDLKAASNGFIAPNPYVYTLQAFFGWKTAAARAGLLYGRQATVVRPSFNDETVKELVSLYAVSKVWGKDSAYARVDHLLWNTVDKGGQAYLNLAKQRSTFGIVGLDYPLTPGVNLEPNVEFAYYQNDGGGPVSNQDVTPRVTVAWAF